MPPIYVNTDNSDPNSKIYDGSKAGDAAVAAEQLMQKVVLKVIEKDATFTTNRIKNPKGYTIRLKISKLEVGTGETKCTLSGEILRYPRNTTSKSGSGEEMVSTAMSGSATATGKGKGAVLDCVEAIAESLIPKAIPAMKTDMTRR
jgi:hypothetical protein